MHRRSNERGFASIDDCYEFTGNRFSPTRFPEWEAAEIGTDWDDCLKQSGWYLISTIPESDAAGMSQVKTKIYGKRLQTTRMVEINLAEEDDVLVFCPTKLDLMILLRDFVYPLCGHADLGVIMNKLIDLTSCLLDEERGLECVQRGKDHRFSTWTGGDS
jgi:hypothetical protein